MKNFSLFSITFFLIIQGCCISCLRKPIIDNYAAIQPIIQDTLQAQNINSEDKIFGSALNMFLIDSLLFIEDYFNRDYSLWCINTNTFTLQDTLYKKGRGPGEVQNPSSNGMYDKKKRTISLFEPNYRKLIQYSIADDSYSEFSLRFRDSVLNKTFIQDLFPIDSLFIATGTFGLFHTKRFLLLNRNRKLIKAIDGYPTIEGVPEKDISYICQYANKIRVKPDCTKLVCGTYIGGLLEIFDISQIPDTICLIKQHLIYQPLYNIPKQGGISSATDTKYGFENIFVTNSYIYTLLFDNNSPEQIFPNKIIIFDWKGNPVKSYITDCMLHSICVDEKNQIIYAMAFSEEESFHLVTFNLNRL